MDQLGINLPGLVAQIINFGILYFILSKFVLPRVTSMLSERTRRIEQSLAQVELVQQQAADAQTQVEAQLVEARQQANEIVSRASETANRVRADAQDEARKEAEVIISRARAEIQIERDRAISDLRREFADITITAAERVIKQSLDKDRHAKLIDDVLAEAPSFKGN